MPKPQYKPVELAINNNNVISLKSDVDSSVTRLEYAASMLLIVALDNQIEPAISNALHGVHDLMVSALKDTRKALD